MTIQVDSGRGWILVCMLDRDTIYQHITLEFNLIATEYMNILMRFYYFMRLR